MANGGDRLLYGGLLGIALLAGGVAAATHGSSAPVAETSSSVPTHRTPETSDAVGGLEIADAPRAPADLDPDFRPDLPTVPDLATQPPPPRPPPRDDPRMQQLGAEMRYLARARDLVTEHPSEALGVLRDHRQEYPQGVLREEREAYTVEALVLLEHVAEAERRYYEFRRDFPESDFTERLQEMMQRPPHEVGAGGR
ncbi:MAG: hypothetical protein AB8I08_03375 [Sandaracinaceae bacterium]